MHHASHTPASSDSQSGSHRRRIADPRPGPDGPRGPAGSTPRRARPARPRHLYIIRQLLSLAGRPPLSVTLWDGQVIRASESPPVATIVVHNAQALRRMILNPYYQFCEAYTNGQIDVLGDLVSMMTTIDHSLRASRPAQFLYDLFTRWLRVPRFNSLSASRDNVYHHYDIGNEFYRLWLDEQLAYTCAYFPQPDATLEQAQISKFDHVCRKVDLHPGETVVEAGCGWGGLALHMARHFGVKVKAYNISHEQIDYARKRAQEEGLAGRVEFIEDDWRHIQGRYDAFVSIGMLEHVGKANYRKLGEVVHRVLEKNGRGIIHTIGRNKPAPVDRWIERRIFPGSYPPSLSEILRVLEPRGFSVLDVENLRLHYARTLAHWLERFEQRVEHVRKMFDDRFVRMWRLYLAGSVAAFQEGGLQLFQVVFARPDMNDMPLTRAHVYADVPRVESAAHLA